jgi:lysophospholipase L1-like esterase
VTAWYTSAALMSLNLLVAIVILNLGLWVVFAIKDRATRPSPSSGDGSLFASDGAPLPGSRRTAFQLEWFDANAYGDATQRAHAARVLDDFYALSLLGFAYQPWTQFAEPPFDGDLVHVDADSIGFPHRRTRNQGAATGGQRSLTVFALGGSTTFGYYVADEHTWPSFLSEALNRQAAVDQLGVAVAVENYGRGYYTPSQELILLLDMLKSGHRPDLVLFMDGVNWGGAEDVPHFTRELEVGFHELQFGPHRPRLGRLEQIPMVRLAQSLGRALLPRPTPAPALEPGKPEHLVERFVTTWKVAAAVCDLYGIEHRFFRQPDPVFNYPERLYRRPPPRSFMEERARRVEFHRRLADQEEAIDLTGLFAAWGDGRKAVVDDVHYSPAFNQFLAEKVARHVDLRALVRARPEPSEARATGARRRPVGSRRLE